MKEYFLHNKLMLAGLVGASTDKEAADRGVLRCLLYFWFKFGCEKDGLRFLWFMQ